MAEFNVVHTPEIVSGLTVQSYHLLDNFNALATSTLSKLNKDSAGTQTVGGIVVFNQLEATTISGSPSIPSVGLGTATLTEISDINGLIKGGDYVTTTTATGLPSIGVAQRFHVTHQAAESSTSAVQFLTGMTRGERLYRIKAVGTWGNFIQLPTLVTSLGDTIQGGAPLYASSLEVAMPAIRCMDSTRAVLMSSSTTMTNLSTNVVTSGGINCLDTGTIAANTTYYVWHIMNPTTGVSGFLWSTSSSLPVLPSGYSIYRLLHTPIRTLSGSAVIQPFTYTVGDGWTQCLWASARSDSKLFDTLGLSDATISLASTVPLYYTGKNATVIIAVEVHGSGGTGTLNFRTGDSESSNQILLQHGSTASSITFNLPHVELPIVKTGSPSFKLTYAYTGGAIACSGDSRGFRIMYGGLT